MNPAQLISRLAVVGNLPRPIFRVAVYITILLGFTFAAASVSVAQERGTSQPPKSGTDFADRKAREAAKARGDYTFDDLKFEIEKGEKFTRSKLSKEVVDLDDKTIKIRGYILPASVFQQSGINQFVLVRDNMECCFGPGAAIYDCIIVQMEPGKTTDFTTRPVAVKGKFEIEEFKYPDGSHYAIYKITGTEVK